MQLAPLETTRYAVERGIATITLDRPEQLNAYNARMRLELEAHSRVVGVELLRPVERDRGDAAFDGVARGLQGCKLHRESPEGSSRRSCACARNRRPLTPASRTLCRTA